MTDLLCSPSYIINEVSCCCSIGGSLRTAIHPPLMNGRLPLPGLSSASLLNGCKNPSTWLWKCNMTDTHCCKLMSLSVKAAGAETIANDLCTYGLLLYNWNSVTRFNLFYYSRGKNLSLEDLNKMTKPIFDCIKTEGLHFFFAHKIGQLT